MSNTYSTQHFDTFQTWLVQPSSCDHSVTESSIKGEIIPFEQFQAQDKCEENKSNMQSFCKEAMGTNIYTLKRL